MPVGIKGVTPCNWRDPSWVQLAGDEWPRIRDEGTPSHTFWGIIGQDPKSSVFNWSFLH